MKTSELVDLLDRAQRELGCTDVALWCSCENLEVVYVLRRDTGLAVSDRGETFQYLETASDDIHARVSVPRAQEICRRHGAVVDVSDPESYPHVVRAIGDDPPSAVVEAVAAAIDEIFEEATHAFTEGLRSRAQRTPEKPS